MRPIVQQRVHRNVLVVPARRRPLWPRRMLRVALALAVLMLAAACDGGQKSTSGTPSPGQVAGAPAGAGQQSRSPVTPPPRVTPTPKPSANSSDTAQQFLNLWQQGQYSAMYDLLTSAAKQSISSDKFVARYQAIADEA